MFSPLLHNSEENAPTRKTHLQSSIIIEKLPPEVVESMGRFGQIIQTFGLVQKEPCPVGSIACSSEQNSKNCEFHVANRDSSV